MKRTFGGRRGSAAQLRWFCRPLPSCFRASLGSVLGCSPQLSVPRAAGLEHPPAASAWHSGGRKRRSGDSEREAARRARQEPRQEPLSASDRLCAPPPPDRAGPDRTAACRLRLCAHRPGAAASKTCSFASPARCWKSAQSGKAPFPLGNHPKGSVGRRARAAPSCLPLPLPCSRCPRMAVLVPPADGAVGQVQRLPPAFVPRLFLLYGEMCPLPVLSLQSGKRHNYSGGD